MNTITPPAHTQPTVAKAAVKPQVSQAQKVPADVQAKKTDPVADIQAAKEVRVQRMNQSLDRNQLNYAYNKASSTLSVKVVNKQSGDFIRQIDYKGFHAMVFTSHGYKGQLIDHDA